MPDAVVVDTGVLRGWPLPEPGSDKEERGRLLVVAGTRETPGAALLAVEAAFRVGAGKIRLATARTCGITSSAERTPTMAIETEIVRRRTL